MNVAIYYGGNVRHVFKRRNAFEVGVWQKWECGGVCAFYMF